MIMTKKKKKKNKKSAALPTDPAQLEALARREYAAGRYRRARDAYKQLHKRDPEKFLPNLVACYKSMAAEMLEDGRLTDAEPVFNRLRELTGTPVDPLTLWQSSGSNDGRHGDGPVRTPEEEFRRQTRGADASVILLSGENPSDENAESEPALIHNALKCVCESRYEDAMKHVRGISAKSSFSHWRLFIKGLVSFYRGNDETAVSALTRIPAASAPAEAAKPFMLLLEAEANSPESANRDEWTMRHAGRLSGYAELSDTMARADYFWSKGRYRDALKLVRKSVPDYGKSDESITARLRRFFELSHFHLEERAADKYRDVLFARGERDPDYSEKEYWDLLRILALVLENEGDPLQAERFWKEYMGSLPPPGISKERRDAEILFHIGLRYAEPSPPNPFFAFDRKKPVRDPKKAVDFLKKSIETYENNPVAYKALLNTYMILRWKREQNRLLDTMVEKFPGDKEVLLHAGSACLERKAFQKALKYLERAVSLNRLDTNAAAALVSGYILSALADAKKGRADRMRSHMDKAFERAVEGSESFQFNAGMMLARRAIFEYMLGNQEEGAELESRARQSISSQAVLDYFMYFAARVYAPDRKLPPNTYDARAFGTDPDLKLCLKFLAIHEFAKRMGMPERKMIAEAKRINSFAMKACKAGYDTADALKYIEKCISGEYGNFLESTAKKLLSALLKTDPKNPKYRLLKLELNSFSETGSLSKVRREYDSILKEAGKRNDTESLKEAKSKLERLLELSFPDEFPDEFPERMPGGLGEVLEEIKELAQMEDPFPPRSRKKSRKKSRKPRKASSKPRKTGEQASEIPSNNPPSDNSTQLNLFDSDM